MADPLRNAPRRRLMRVASASLLAVTVWSATATASADPAGTVALSVRAPVVVALGEPVRVTVRVTAAAGVLDPLTPPARLRVRVARACGPTFGTTSGGSTVLDARLSPAPVAGAAYHGVATARVTSKRFGYRFVCAFVEQTGAGAALARDAGAVLVTTHTCTKAVRAQRLALSRLAVARHALHGAGDPTRRRVLAERVASARAAAMRAGRGAKRGCKAARVG